MERTMWWMWIGCHILKLKCTKFAFGWDSAPDWLDFRGLLLRGRKGVKGGE